MVSLNTRSPRHLAGALAVAVIVAACGGGTAAIASPSPSETAVPTPTARPTARPTPRPIPSPIRLPTPKPTTPKPTPAPPVEAAAALKIGAPYRLVANRANLALTGSLTLDIAGQHIEERISGREIWQGTKMVGLALVLEFVGVKMTPAIFDAGAGGAARNVNGKLTFSTILGTRVAFATAPSGTFGLYPLHDTIVVVAGIKAADTKPLLTSVIKANK